MKLVTKLSQRPQQVVDENTEATGEEATSVGVEMMETPVEDEILVADETAEISASEIEEQASLFVQKQKSNDTMRKILTNTLEPYTDTVEEKTKEQEIMSEQEVEQQEEQKRF